MDILDRLPTTYSFAKYSETMGLTIGSVQTFRRTSGHPMTLTSRSTSNAPVFQFEPLGFTGISILCVVLVNSQGNWFYYAG